VGRLGPLQVRRFEAGDPQPRHVGQSPARQGGMRPSQCGHQNDSQTQQDQPPGDPVRDWSHGCGPSFAGRKRTAILRLPRHSGKSRRESRSGQRAMMGSWNSRQAEADSASCGWPHTAEHPASIAARWAATRDSTSLRPSRRSATSASSVSHRGRCAPVGLHTPSGPLCCLHPGQPFTAQG
jgi:hypothetical protein